MGLQLKQDLSIKRLALSCQKLCPCVPRELHQQKPLEAEGCLSQPCREFWAAGLALNHNVVGAPSCVFSLSLSKGKAQISPNVFDVGRELGRRGQL